MILRSITTILFGIALASLIGCTERQVRDERSPWFRITAGSVVELNQSLEVPAGSTRIFLQHGRVIGKSQLDHYYPNCNFEVRQLDSIPRWIRSGEFFVTGVQWGEEQVVEWHGVRITHRFWGSPFSDDSPSVYRYYHYRLESLDQPNLLRLTCRGGLADRHRADLPSLQEIRDALGDIASITPVN